MRILLLFSLAINFFTCTEYGDGRNDSDNNPIVNPPVPEVKKYFIGDYGVSIDSNYFTVWSDGSWEKFYTLTTNNNHTILSVINNLGTEYYYDETGYIGLKLKNESPIFFNSSLGFIPDTLIFGQKYERKTSFYYSGYNYILKTTHQLEDTVAVSHPIGTFRTCLWMKTTTTLSAGSQSETSNADVFSARGPSTIRIMETGKESIDLVGGNINGIFWGDTLRPATSMITDLLPEKYLGGLPTILYLKKFDLVFHLGSNTPSY